MTTTEVAIVGSGPVGKTLAILLAQHGHSVVMLERWPTPYPMPRAVHFDDEVGRILQACGLADEVAAISEPAGIYEWQNATGETLMRFGRLGHGHSAWPASNLFHQPELEDVLDDRIAELPLVTVRRGCDVTGLEQSADGVGLDVRPVVADAAVSGGLSFGPVDPELSVNARYVVGCDGANSTVRSLVDAPVEDLGFFYDWLILDVRIGDEVDGLPEHLVQVCDPARPTTVVRAGPGRRRWEFMALPHESVDDLNRESTAWMLLEPWGVTPANADLDRHTVYRFQARWVERWRTDRVLLAGDAAHQMPPFAGQGMCAGIRDAANLAWKLDLVLAGASSDALLDTYELERKPRVRRVVEFSMELGKVICVPDVDEAAARDAVMLAEFDAGAVNDIPPLPPIQEGLCCTGSAGGGELFVQGLVTAPTSPGVERRFDDVVGAGWRLVTVPGLGVLDGQLGEWFISIGGRHVMVGSGADLEDGDGCVSGWLEKRDVRAVLQRPDFYVYGSARDAAGVDAMVGRLRHELG